MTTIKILLYFIPLIIILASIGYFYYNKLLKLNSKISSNLNNLQEIQKKRDQINEELINCAEFSDNINSFTSSLENLVKLISQYFGAEYCVIGSIDGEYVEDIAHYTSKIVQKPIEYSRKVERAKISDCLVGRTIKTNRLIDFFDNSNSDFAKLKNAKVYINEILHSRTIERVIVLGIYTNEGIPIAYLELINYDKNNCDEDYLLLLNRHLKSIFVNSVLKYEIENKIRDEKFINELILKSEYNIGKILDSIMEYFSKEFRSGLISFRIPSLNSIDDLEQNQDILFLLRRYYIDPDLPNKAQIDDYYKKNIAKQSKETKYWRLINDKPDSLVIIEKVDDINKDLNELLGVKNKFINSNIIIPIYKPNRELICEPWKCLYGVFYLRLYDIDNYEQLTVRLSNLSVHLTHIISSTINKKRYNQVNKFHEEIKKLNYSESETIYYQSACLIKNVVDAEVCSIFVLNESDDNLYLKSTTASNVKYKGKILNLQHSKNSDIYFNLEETDSLVVKTFLLGKAKYIYDINYVSSYSEKFMEVIVNATDHSLILTPLYNHDKKLIGIINCVGKNKSKLNLLESFWESDLELVELVVGIVSQFIENVQFSLDKDEFIKQFLHELTTPVSELVHSSSYMYNTITRGIIKKDMIKLIYSIDETVGLLDSIIKDLEFLSQFNANELKYDIKLCDVKQIIIQVVRPLELYAHAEKQISIRLNIGDIPPLMIDKARFKQIVINLLKNAIKYSDNYSTIQLYYNQITKHIEGYKNNNWHEIQFVNDGIPVLSREKDVIFKKYKRGSNAASKSPSGSGIGLFVVNEIIKAMGGICFVSSLEKPTIFSVLLPKK